MDRKLQNLSPDQEYYFHKNVYLTLRESILARDRERSEWYFTIDIRAEVYEIVEKFVEEDIVREAFFSKIFKWYVWSSFKK